MFIRAYQGTVIFVSHDQTFIEQVADVQFHISKKKLKAVFAQKNKERFNVTDVA